MHLTNYAINKESDKFVNATGQDDNSANKRSLASVLEHIQERENKTGINAESVMAQI